MEKVVVCVLILAVGLLLLLVRRYRKDLSSLRKQLATCRSSKVEGDLLTSILTKRPTTATLRFLSSDRTIYLLWHHNDKWHVDTANGRTKGKKSYIHMSLGTALRVCSCLIAGVDIPKDYDIYLLKEKKEEETQ